MKTIDIVYNVVLKPDLEELFPEGSSIRPRTLYSVTELINENGISYYLINGEWHATDNFYITNVNNN